MDKKVAKALLDAYNLYSLREFEHDPISSLPEDSVLHVAYTTDEDDEGIELQLDYNFLNEEYIFYMNDVKKATIKQSIEETISDFELATFDGYYSTMRDLEEEQTGDNLWN